MQKELLKEKQVVIKDNWKLVWEEDFSAPQLNEEVWNYEEGPWPVNKELQCYTKNKRNIRIENSQLVIEARKETCEGRQYTSARINTYGKKSFQFGKIEARIKLPGGKKGCWPAFWMLGNNRQEAGWPQCGEIDIMENKGSQSHTVSGALHGPGYSGDNTPVFAMFRSESKLHDQFHLYSIIWEKDRIMWYVDNQFYYSMRKEDVPGEWVYNDQPFYLLLNFAVGGIFDGDPDETSRFPAQYVVDYIHVYQKIED